MIITKKMKLGFIIDMIILFTLLTVKLLNVVTWSWWVITMPLWGPFVLLLITIIFVALLSWLLCTSEDMINNFFR